MVVITKGVDKQIEPRETREKALLNTTVGKLTEKNDALELGTIVMKEENKATLMTLNTRIKELKGELTVYRILIGKKVLGTTPSHKIDVPKPKTFKGARSARGVDNLLWEMEQYLRRDEEGQDVNNNDNCGNGKPQNGKGKPNNKSKEKKSDIQCFLCCGPHKVRDCP
ncbi:hypothetical protein Gotri_005588 [Gossypium trilobum]|uniref:Uncharacterized protein n=1 Tax=Gossypium trilobum TaxID=34281 RepID=A0A7J9EXE9_9ROSI|nr:hypothetical protein [Gossypium trilobum]